MSTRAESGRLFFALVPPADLRAELAELTDAVLAGDARGQDFRAVPAEDIHLTVLFVGRLFEPAPEELGRAFAQRALGLAAPTVRVHGTGAFPDERRARVLWFGVEEELGSLSALRDAVVDAARSAGWREDSREAGQPFRGHVTVARARARRGERAPAMPRSFLDVKLDRPWTPDALVLLESRLERVRDRYRRVASAALLAARPPDIGR